MDATLGVARESGVFVIDDAAQAMGATYKGRLLVPLVTQGFSV